MLPALSALSVMLALSVLSASTALCTLATVFDSVINVGKISTDVSVGSFDIVRVVGNLYSIYSVR